MIIGMDDDYPDWSTEEEPAVEQSTLSTYFKAVSENITPEYVRDFVKTWPFRVLATSLNDFDLESIKSIIGEDAKVTLIDPNNSLSKELSALREKNGIPAENSFGVEIESNDWEKAGALKKYFDDLGCSWSAFVSNDLIRALDMILDVLSKVKGKILHDLDLIRLSKKEQHSIASGILNNLCDMVQKLETEIEEKILTLNDMHNKFKDLDMRANSLRELLTSLNSAKEEYSSFN